MNAPGQRAVGSRPTSSRRRRILGIPVSLAIDHPVAREIADQALAAWPPTRAQPQLRLRVDVVNGEAEAATGRPLSDAAGQADAPLRYDIRPPGLRIAGPGIDARVHVARGRALVRASARALRDHARFRYGVLEAALLFLATTRDRVPFHAAGLVRDGRAALLAGRSGAGKDTLALAALRRDTGWRLLSEDCVYLETTRPRVWGWPGFLHVSPDSVRFFEELRGQSTTVTAAGKEKVAVHHAGPIVRAAPAAATVLLLLDRTPAGPSLDRLLPAAVRHELSAGPEPGFDRFAEHLPAALGTLPERAWRFDTGNDPSRAAAFLESELPGLVAAESLDGA